MSEETGSCRDCSSTFAAQPASRSLIKSTDAPTIDSNKGVASQRVIRQELQNEHQIVEPKAQLNKGFHTCSWFDLNRSGHPLPGDL